MNKQPSLQSAVVAGLSLLSDPEVRIPTTQVEGVAALRMLLQALASGQLVVQEPAVAPVAEPAEAYPAARKPRKPRAPKVNGATVADVAAAPVSVQ